MNQRLSVLFNGGGGVVVVYITDVTAPQRARSGLLVV
jgi:hypothetical protein